MNILFDNEGKKKRRIFSIIHFLFLYLCDRKTKGCPTDNDEWAEIIPCEPDAVSTAEGIVTAYHTSIRF